MTWRDWHVLCLAVKSLITNNNILLWTTFWSIESTLLSICHFVCCFYVACCCWKCFHMERERKTYVCNNLRKHVSSLFFSFSPFLSLRIVQLDWKMLRFAHKYDSHPFFFRWRHISKQFSVKCTITSWKFIENQIVFICIFLASLSLFAAPTDGLRETLVRMRRTHQGNEQNSREIAKNILKENLLKYFKLTGVNTHTVYDFSSFLFQKLVSKQTILYK